MSKKKILSILIIAILFCVCLLNSKVFATNIVTIDASNTSGTTTNTGASSITITSQSGNNTVNNTANQTTNQNTSVNNLTSSTNNNATKNNVSSYNNVANKANTAAGLPYTGSNSSVVFIVVAFVASAAYAWKKIKDYNI